MRGGGDEYPMLIVADQPPAAVHRQRLGDDETARAAAEFDDHRRAELLDRIDDIREEARVGFPTPRCGSASSRSEEHTSELQSLMRISYAVFCLKKKNERKKKQLIK